MPVGGSMCRMPLGLIATAFLVFAVSLPQALPQTRSSKPDLSGLTAEERRAIDGACILEKSGGGPAAYYRCLRDQLASMARGPSKPDLSGLTAEERRAIDGACILEKSGGGPAAYYRCLRDQLASMARGPSKPDLSGLTAEERRAIDGACILEKSGGGPAAYYRCLRDQLASMARGPSKPDLSVTAEERRAIDGACILEKSGGGPAAYYRCLRDQLASMARGPSKPDLSGLTAEERRAIDGACILEKSGGGPAAYYRCLRNQLAALGGPIREAPPTPPPSYRTPTPRTTPPRVAYTSPRISRPSFEWPAWSAGLPGAPPRTLTAPLDPAALFKKVAPSVYVIIAAPSRERLFAKTDIAQGSAVAVSKQTLITNCHVLTNAGFIVVLQEDNVAQAELVKANPDTDRCVLQVTDDELSPVPGVRPFQKLAIGERVYSIGTPSGLQQTLGEGLISGLREHDGVKLIQTSAPISSGSSGGGLFDASGNLVGVTTFMLRDAQALNFAIAAAEYWR